MLVSSVGIVGGGAWAHIGGRQSVLPRQNISNRIYPTTPFSALMMMMMTMITMPMTFPRPHQPRSPLMTQAQTFLLMKGLTDSFQPEKHPRNSALWVKQWKLRRSKVLNSKPCYAFNFDPKTFKPFLDDAKLPNVYD